jgi:hypothetical protein
MALQAMKEIDIDNITPFHQNQGEETQRLLPAVIDASNIQTTL